MSIYYKFKSAKDYESISINDHFITVLCLKENIYESKHMFRGTDYDLIITNAQTNEEYDDEHMLIPKNTSVIVRRIPGPPRKPLVASPISKPKVFNELDIQQAKNNFSTNYVDFSEFDDFGSDIYEINKVVPVMSNNQHHDSPASSKSDDVSKIHTRDFGRLGGFGRKIPPSGYVCHRCKTPGHFIQHCPTNGDPDFDFKKVKHPTGIPKSILMVSPDGSYALSNGSVAVLEPNEAVFEKEIEGIPSTSTVGDFSQEFHCLLCKRVMKDAVFTSKCCFKSFCVKCIRDHIIEKSACVCGATNVLADDLLPNMTIRDAINRILESNNSSVDNGVQDTESAKCEQSLQNKNLYPAPSATAKVEKPARTEHDVTSTEAVKKKKKKLNLPISEEMQWNYMIPNMYNLYWNAMQPGMAADMGPYGGSMPYTYYGLGPMMSPGLGPMMSPIIPHQRDLIMSQDEYEEPRGELKRKRDGTTTSSRELPKERESSQQTRDDGHHLRAKRPSPDNHHHSQQHKRHCRLESSFTRRQPQSS